MAPLGWSTRQLAEFLEVVSAAEDVATARQKTVDRVAEALQADLAAITSGGSVLASAGVEAGAALAEAGAALAELQEGAMSVELPGVGRCMALTVPIRTEPGCSLVVARSAAPGFSAEEAGVARGLAHTLAMAERMLRDRERERELRRRSEAEARERELIEADYRSLVERVPAIVYTAEVGERGRWTYVSPQIEEILGYTPQEWMDDPGLWFTRVHPKDRELALVQEGEVAIGGPEQRPVEYRLIARDGSQVWIRDEAVLRPDAAGHPVWHGVLYEITEQKRFEAELERVAAQHAAVSQLGERALNGEELEELMADAAGLIAASQGVDQSCVWELDAARGRLTARAEAGFDLAEEQRSMPASSDSPAGLAVTSGRPVMVGDWEEEFRFEPPAYLRGTSARCTIAAPISGESQTLGALEVHSARREGFSLQDVHFAQSAANVLAHAIERRSAGEQIRHGALHDQVTGLPNRGLFVDRIERALSAAEGRETPVAVFFCDLDNFKIINDSFGHEAGDGLLRAVVPRLRKQLRSMDTVARLGGDEFAILVEEVVDETEATRIGERICSAFEEPYMVERLEQRLTASVGIAVSGAEAGGAESLIREAHAAMYRAKERGRNRAELFDAEMRSKAVSRLQMERDLRRAIDLDQLSLHYQPIVDLSTGELPALEALLRWEHAQRGPVEPEEFIPIAEESGLIEPIGRWVIERACQQSVIWHQLRPDARPIDVTVNLSARQFAQRNLPEVVAGILERTGLEPIHLKFEITETVLVEKSGAADRILRELNQLGMQLILDDFGTGYSSLAYLNRFPFNAIKIDRSFIEGLGIEPERTAIVEAIVSMARALHLRTIAEGVENQVQLAELRRLGCTYAQGFLFSGPLAVPEMGALLQRAAEGSPFKVGAPSRPASEAEAPQ